MTRTGLLVATAAVAAGIGAAAAVLSNDRWSDPELHAILGLAIGWSFVASGLVAARERPESRTGAVMALTGFLWLASLLEWSNDSVPFTIGTFLETAYLLGLGYLLVTFPHGRLDSRAGRALVAVGFSLTMGLELGYLLFADARAVICDDCPDNAFLITRDDGLADGLLSMLRAVGIVASIVLATLLVRRWRGASAPLRRAASPLLWVGSATFVTVLIGVVNDILDEALGRAPDVLWRAALASVPIAYLAGLLRVRLGRAAVADLVVELQGATEPGRLRDALARALGDPTLEVAYWLPAGERYVDADGRPVEVPATATPVERDGRRIAALIHDPALRDDPELVRSACAAAGLALENERLQAELRARLEDLRASRARIVEAAADERRRIERNLHDGTQQRLVSIAMALGLAEARAGDDVRPMVHEARESISTALQELRELSQGIHPAILTERGLGEALGELARHATVPVDVAVDLPRRPPPAVEAAGYYVVAEALANVAKHARARSARASATLHNGRAVLEVADDGVGGADRARGTGLRGLEDRVEALGGTLSITSPPGGGTILRVELPCA